MFRSIRSRLTLSYLLVILLSMGVAAGLAWSALDRAFLDVLRENLLAQARRVAQTVEAGAAEAPQDTPESYSQLANLTPGLTTRVIDDEGAVVLNLNPEVPPATSGEDPTYSQAANALPGYTERIIDEDGAVVAELGAGQEISSTDSTRLISGDSTLARNLGLFRSGSTSGGRVSTDESVLVERPEIRSALAGEPATALRSYAWASQRRILYAAYPIRTPDGRIGSVAYIASPLPRLTLSLLPAYFGWQALGGMSAAILLAGLAGLLLAQQLTHPLQRLTDAAAALARGEAAPTIPPAPAWELDRLGAAFNTMNENLAAATSALAAQARQREAILDGLADAVLAAGANGEIVLANPAGSVLLEAAPAAVSAAIRGTLAGRQPQRVEVVARNRVVELLTTPLQGAEGQAAGVVAVGHDVTDYRQLDRLRSNFVSDVSHELRTPLTAIKGSIETLQDGAAEDPQARAAFLETLSHETERLIRLTNDLLLLTRADAGRLPLHLAPVDLDTCVQRAFEQLQARAAVGGIELAVEAAGPALVRADADRVQQVLINLLDNALKFTPPGGRVEVRLSQHGDEMRCSVTDTGAGIAAGELPHLFERFYRGDRSRARGEHAGGTGLGLAIARASVEAHGGRIWIDSQPGQGTAVTFTLPACN